MKKGWIIAGAFVVAAVAGGGGFLVGAKYTANSLIDGGQYVFGAKPMPQKAKEVGVDAGAFPTIDPWQTAVFNAQSYCLIIEATQRTLPIECQPFLDALD